MLVQSTVNSSFPQYLHLLHAVPLIVIKLQVVKSEPLPPLRTRPDRSINIVNDDSSVSISADG
jgi:hypothetical protein